MIEWYKQQRDKYHNAYIAAVKMEEPELAAKHLKEYENYCEQIERLS